MTRRLVDKMGHPALAAALAVVLLSLAWLQYRWIGEISEADRERLRTGLTVATMQFRAEFNRRLAATALEFMPRPGGGSNAAGAAYGRLAGREQEVLPLRGVYLWEQDGEAGPRLRRVNPETLELEDAEWPADIAAHRPPREPVSLRRTPGFPGGGPPRGFGWAFLGEGPAVALPMFNQGGFGGPGRGRFEPSGRLYLEIDRARLVESVLPEIERLYYESGGDRLYQVAVLDDDAAVYVSEPGLTASDFDGSEVRIALLWSLEEIASRFAEFRRGGSRRDDGPQADGGFERRPPGPEGVENRRERLVGFGRGGRAGEFGDGDGASWMLVARHRAGPLDAVVSQLRRRNMAISFGILLLLGAGMGFALVSAQRAERLARLQLDFVAGVSHELRTPLAVIRQAGDNLAAGVVSEPDHVREYGRLIRDEGRRLTGMVEHSLDFAKSQSGKREYRVEDVPLKQMLDEVLDEVRPAIAAAGIELEVETPDDPPTVRADRAAVTQCLRNLLSNAMKYGGEARWVGLRVSEQPGRAVVEVRDRGMGVAAEDLPHIFDPFYRGKQAKDAQIQGSGLGLALAKDAATAAGGDLTAVSHPGEGSVFTLWLPKSDGSANAGASGSGSEVAGSAEA